jgi:hypothetical protein
MCLATATAVTSVTAHATKEKNKYKKKRTGQVSPAQHHAGRMPAGIPCSALGSNQGLPKKAAHQKGERPSPVHYQIALPAVPKAATTCSCDHCSAAKLYAKAPRHTDLSALPLPLPLLLLLLPGWLLAGWLDNHAVRYLFVGPRWATKLRGVMVRAAGYHNSGLRKSVGSSHSS